MPQTRWSKHRLQDPLPSPSKSVRFVRKTIVFNQNQGPSPAPKQVQTDQKSTQNNQKQTIFSKKWCQVDMEASKGQQPRPAPAMLKPTPSMPKPDPMHAHNAFSMRYNHFAFTFLFIFFSDREGGLLTRRVFQHKFRAAQRLHIILLLFYFFLKLRGV